LKIDEKSAEMKQQEEHTSEEYSSSKTLRRTSSTKMKLQQQHKIRDQIHQLRNIRKMMFYSDEDGLSQAAASEQSVPVPGKSKANITVNSINGTDQESVNTTQPSYHDNLVRNKLRSTVQLLSESLEEQANLKALLEISFNPSVYDVIVQSEIMHLSHLFHPNKEAEVTSSAEKLTVSEELLANIKYRSLLLEKEHLMSKVGLLKSLNSVIFCWLDC
jgi:hypothetical protein